MEDHVKVLAAVPSKRRVPIAWWVTAVFALSIAAYSLRYVFLGERAYTPELAPSFRARPLTVMVHTLFGPIAHAWPRQSPTSHEAGTAVAGASMARPNLSRLVDRPWRGGTVAVVSRHRRPEPAYSVWTPRARDAGGVAYGLSIDSRQGHQASSRVDAPELCTHFRGRDASHLDANSRHRIPGTVRASLSMGRVALLGA